MAIVINGSGTVTGLAVGGLPDGTVDAGTLATNSVDSAELVDGAVDDSHMASIKGRKNLIINGGMNVWQRATVFTGNQAGFKGADRWKCTYQDAGAIQQERVDYTSSTGDIYNSMKLTCTTSGSYANSIRFQYNLETADVVGLRGKTVTASAYVKQLHSDSNFHNFGFQYSNSATDYAAFGSWTAANSAAYTSSLTVNSFVRISRTYTVPNDARSLCVFFDCQSDTGNTNAIIEIANIQLEVGSTATEFEHRSFGEELALCKRYYEKSFEYETTPANGADTSSFLTSEGITSASAVLWHANNKHTVRYEVEKRIEPTVTRYGNSQGYWGYINAATSPSGSNSAHVFHQHLLCNNNCTKTFEINNQVSGNPLWGVRGHWTADAEL
jgi:hypothetical protein